MNNATINTDVTMAGDGGQSLLANRYRVIKQLGQGGMGSVWLAEDTVLDNRKVAIKMLPSILFANTRAYNQLKSEALVAMKLSHPNIAAVRSFEENGGNPFIVEDYIEGQTLDAYLAERCAASSVSSSTGSSDTASAGLPEDEVIRLLTPVAAALDYAHREGVVHRDVKPANVMIRKDGTPFVLDFGIAREAQETMTMVTGKLSSGTLLYMSPEQLNGALPKPAQDVYSFAAMVYECLAGQPPFCRGQIEYQIINNPPPPLGPHFINCGPVMAGLAKDPADRPATCAAVLSPGGLSKSGGTPALRAAAASKDASRKLFPIVALLMLLLAILGGLFAWRAHERNFAAEAREAELVRLREQASQEKSAAEAAAAERIRETEAETAKRLAAAEAEAERVRKEKEKQAAAWEKQEAERKAREQAEAERREAERKAAEALKLALAQYEAAQKAKETAFAHLEPSLQVEVVLDGKSVTGAKVKIGSETKDSPVAALKPKQGETVGPFAAAYKVADKRYVAQEKSVTVDWLGPKTVQLVLKEYTGPKAGDVKIVTLPGGAKLELVYCPPGEFLMGSPETEEGREDDEKQHRVTLTKGFWIGKYEVTQAQWKSVMGANPSGFKGDDRPVNFVSWGDCQEFLKKSGLGLRLPTEAEWEYACRAGSTGSYAGMGRLDEMGWYDDNSARTTHPVGQKKPNAWGLYDMHGNVREWCQDSYGSYDGDVRDPQGPASGVIRVSRGGSWSFDARSCRSADRCGDSPGGRSNSLGFRIACSGA